MPCVTLRLHLPLSFSLLHMHVLTYAVYTVWAFFGAVRQTLLRYLEYPLDNKTEINNLYRIWWRYVLCMYPHSPYLHNWNISLLRILEMWPFHTFHISNNIHQFFPFTLPCMWRASWFGGRSFWLLITRFDSRFCHGNFPLQGKIPIATMVWVACRIWV
jgi:hypothetical protein